MTDSELAQYQGGQLLALHAIVNALIGVHPDPEALQREFRQLIEYQVSELLPTQSTERFLAGHQDTTECVNGFLAVAVGVQQYKPQHGA